MMRFLLFPLTMLYGLAVYLRNFLFDFNILKSNQFDIPVISVGNITVGGTGKTPHVEYLVKLLKEEYRIAVLSRGYKRKSEGLVLAAKNPVTFEIGDEPAQIKYKFPEIEVVVNASRTKGIEFLMQGQSDVIILDDAFQHRYVKSGISILLIDFNRRIDKSFLLPYGDLRESAKEIKRADIIIISKTPSELKPIDRRIIFEQIKLFPYQKLYFTSLIYGELKPVSDMNKSIPEDFYKNHEIYSILVVTGIAYSKPFLQYLENYSLDITHIELKDHSSYNKARQKRILNAFMTLRNDRKIIITTEKDAIKLREQTDLDETLINNMYFIPIEVNFIENEIEFKNQMFNYVTKNKRNNKVHPGKN